MVLGYLYGQKSTPKAYFQYIILTEMNPIIHCASLNTSSYPIVSFVISPYPWSGATLFEMAPSSVADSASDGGSHRQTRGDGL